MNLLWWRKPKRYIKLSLHVREETSAHVHEWYVEGHIRKQDLMRYHTAVISSDGIDLRCERAKQADAISLELRLEVMRRDRDRLQKALDKWCAYDTLEESVYAEMRGLVRSNQELSRENEQLRNLVDSMIPNERRL